MFVSRFPFRILQRIQIKEPVFHVSLLAVIMPTIGPTLLPGDFVAFALTEFISCDPRPAESLAICNLTAGGRMHFAGAT
jgi:hypothetical protein